MISSVPQRLVKCHPCPYWQTYALKNVQKEMRVLIKRQLRACNYREEVLDPLAEGIIDMLKRRQGK